MEKLKRLGDILYAFDAYDVFEYYKLSGASALQFLIFDIGFITHALNFDLDTTLEISKVNELRNVVNKELPKILQQKNFAIDIKKTKLTGKVDSYVIHDLKTKHSFSLNFNYLNRVHILKPEYFARKDNHFEDLHIYALSNLENYAKYIVEYLEGLYDDKLLNYLLKENKIMVQQYPFLRKLVTFYISVSDHRSKIDLDNLPNSLKSILEFNEKELLYLEKAIKNDFDLTLILPPTMATKMDDHPKIKMWRQNK